MNRGASKNGEWPNNKMPGITKDLAALRANPRIRCKGAWNNNGKKRTPLYAALLRMKGLLPAENF